LAYRLVIISGGGQGGESQEKRGVGGVREAGEEGRWEGAFPRGSGRNRENYATLCKILQSKQCKGAGANKYRMGTGMKGYGKQEVNPPPPFNKQSVFISQGISQQPFNNIIKRHHSQSPLNVISHQILTLYLVS